ncbi:oxidoreductase [Acrasis kona]|uniref:Oxidoreductase n=1 Tax=Acrasis kona TaxID=1008807 RepID=A0AAW2YZL7_9EUKA
MSNTNDHALDIGGEHGIKLPGITNESKDAVKKLLKTDFEENHIFFNNRRFHNHITHHLLACYSIGAQEERLKKIYFGERLMQRPKVDHKYDITESNWTKFLNDEFAYTDYANFFLEQISKNGLKQTFEKYAFSEPLFNRLTSGIFHPLIHVGYGLEFENELMMAEGLAMTAVHIDHVPEEHSFFTQSSPESSTSLIEIFSQIKTDKRFDLIKYHTEDKFDTLIENRSHVIREYVDKWYVASENLNVKIKELYDLIAVMYGSTAIRPDKRGEIRLSFVLMHCLTSMYFVEIFTHYTPESHIVPFLRNYLFAVIGHYVAEGRPQVHKTTLWEYKSNNSENTLYEWDDIIQKTINVEDEHACKVIRSLYNAHVVCGHSALYLNAAQMTLDHIQSVMDWSGDSIGFDEAWNPMSYGESMKRTFIGAIDKLTGVPVVTMTAVTNKTIDKMKEWKNYITQAE